ncbi:hypothetical protein PRIPAC_83441 [Pristionchus pacificus]|uniref:Uncharacterized protein n=1 Tax=Pristionchus pacificus TaxID=54126 RepID=A0A2A6CEK2_PRIPA|nr:hypothetical protein PRIPAC_83441 [Pristionchus pacificus]|eukprot:PDM76530.1 hypothetical protein PRIPAC_42896 [Pristionchus pacificus]
MATDYRQIFFTKMQIIGDARRFSSKEADALFLSLFEMHRESAQDVIIKENMTEEEKDFKSSVADFCHIEQSLLSGFKRYGNKPNRYYGTEIEVRLGSHALYKHPWWHGRYETASPKKIVLNYKFDDEYPYIWPEMPS